MRTVRSSDNEAARKIPPRRRTGAGTVFCAVLCLAVSAAQARDIRKFHAPKALETHPLSINASGTISGYSYNFQVYRAFLRAPSGGYTVYNILADTLGYGVSDDGHTTGTTGDYDGAIFHGFVRAPDGTVAMFDAPKAIYTLGVSINNSGAVAGWYHNRKGNEIGFVRQPDGTLFPVKPLKARAVRALGINASGVVAGYYRGAGTSYYGFVRAADGTLTTIQCPRSRTTQAMAINDDGVVTGTCMDRHLVWHGFVRDSAGTLTLFDTPVGDTRPVAIAADGSVAGWCFNGPGFVRKPAGEITTFMVRDSTQTIAEAINSTGVITGTFYDFDGNYVGFVRTP
jgi:hypothetical protein